MEILHSCKLEQARLEKEKREQKRRREEKERQKVREEEMEKVYEREQDTMGKLCNQMLDYNQVMEVMKQTRERAIKEREVKRREEEKEIEPLIREERELKRKLEEKRKQREEVQKALLKRKMKEVDEKVCRTDRSRTEVRPSKDMSLVKAPVKPNLMKPLHEKKQVVPMQPIPIYCYSCN